MPDSSALLVLGFIIGFLFGMYIGKDDDHHWRT